MDITGPDLIRRARAIRLPFRTIASEAGLEPHTVGDLARENRGGTRLRTLQAVRRVIERHERATFDHLKSVVNQ